MLEAALFSHACLGGSKRMCFDTCLSSRAVVVVVIGDERERVRGRGSGYAQLPLISRCRNHPEDVLLSVFVHPHLDLYVILAMISVPSSP
jgi:hypothetical protein